MKPKGEICNMQILLVAATEAEIAPFLISHPSCDYLLTGVGVPATIYHLQKRITQVDYDLVIQAGIAGGFKGRVQIGEVFFISSDCFADLGAFEKDGFRSLFEMKLANADDMPFSNGRLINPFTMPENMLIRSAKAVTVNMVSGNKELNDSRNEYHAEVESMEGAALHYVCLQEGVPFMQLRSVSNYVGERDKMKWDIEQSVRNLNQQLEAVYLYFLEQGYKK